MIINEIRIVGIMIKEKQKNKKENYIKSKIWR